VARREHSRLGILCRSSDRACAGHLTLGGTDGQNQPAAHHNVRLRRASVPLWSIFGSFDVGSELPGVGGQIEAATPERAVRWFLKNGGIAESLAYAPDGWPRRFTGKDITTLRPMKGLTNVHMYSVTRKRKGMTLFVVRTVEQPQSNSATRATLSARRSRASARAPQAGR
jgi:hypothetical protein